MSLRGRLMVGLIVGVRALVQVLRGPRAEVEKTTTPDADAEARAGVLAIEHGLGLDTARWAIVRYGRNADAAVRQARASGGTWPPPLD